MLLLVFVCELIAAGLGIYLFKSFYQWSCRQGLFHCDSPEAEQTHVFIIVSIKYKYLTKELEIIF